MNKPLASPSLWNPTPSADRLRNGDAKPGAYEIKFLVDESLVSQFIPVVHSKMTLDSYADPTTGGYSVEGIYYETAALNVFNKTPGYSRKKFRIRRYSQGETLFLERKSKRRGIVTKRRIQLEAQQLPDIIKASLRDQLKPEPISEPSGHTEMNWFAKRLDTLMLRPTLCIAYDRIAFLQADQLGPIRLTIDRRIGCCRLEEEGFPCRSSYKQILGGKCIVELKYRETMPSLFRQFVEEFRLEIQPVSKFRHGMLATGLATEGEPIPSKGSEAC